MKVSIIASIIIAFIILIFTLSSSPVSSQVSNGLPVSLQRNELQRTKFGFYLDKNMFDNNYNFRIGWELQNAIRIGIGAYNDKGQLQASFRDFPRGKTGELIDSVQNLKTIGRYTFVFFDLSMPHEIVRTLSRQLTTGKNIKSKKDVIIFNHKLVPFQSSNEFSGSYRLRYESIVNRIITNGYNDQINASDLGRQSSNINPNKKPYTYIWKCKNTSNKKVKPGWYTISLKAENRTISTYDQNDLTRLVTN